MVSFVDHVVTLTIFEEVQEERSEGWENGDLLARTVTATVDEVLYSYDGAPPVPAEISIGTVGAFIEADGTAVDVVDDGPRFEVGESYVVGINQHSDGRWSELTDRMVFRLDGGVLLGEPADDGIRSEVSGWTLDEFRDQIAATPLNRFLPAGEYLPSLARYALVEDAELEVAPPPTTGPPTTSDVTSTTRADGGG